jgi:hypothetical protein
MKSAPSIPHCSFCARPQSEVGLLFRSSVGAVPPYICDDCVAGYWVVVEADRRSRELAAGLIREWNAAVDNQQSGRTKPSTPHKVQP